MKLFKLAILYFSLVFGAGFILGTFRVLLLVPNLGNRLSELLEMPLMLVVIVLVARWLNQRLSDVKDSIAHLWIGLGALSLVFVAELGVGFFLRGESPVEALVNRDSVSGTAYYLMLGVFALMPWLLARNSEVRSRSLRSPSSISQ
jgi:hypothetical protein